MALFERVFRGSDEMFAKAEQDLNAVIAELGESAPMAMPSTAYYLACIYAYLGRKVTTLGELKAAMTDIRALMTRENRTASIFSSGVATAIAAEVIEACKYARSETPYEGTHYHGHFADAEVRELGEYLGFGPSAASDFAGKRFSAVADLRGYIDGIRQHGPILRECETIPMRERAGEYVMLRLRTNRGINAEEYEKGFLMPFKPLEALLSRFEARGYAKKEEDNWVLTEQGWLVSNQIILALNEAQEKSTPLAKKR